MVTNNFSVYKTRLYTHSDSSHLPVIEGALKASEFNTAKSSDLGLLLGLSAHIPYEVLKSQSSDEPSLLLGYLMHWLESGKATAQKLIQSLKSIDEDLAGDTIEKCKFLNALLNFMGL